MANRAYLTKDEIEAENIHTADYFAEECNRFRDQCPKCDEETLAGVEAMVLRLLARVIDQSSRFDRVPRRERTKK